MFLHILSAAAIAAALMFIDARVQAAAGAKRLQEPARIAGELGLTDLCLCTEANYTRHPSQADMHTPFADGPAVLEHFPSGSLVMPPSTMRKMNAKMD